MGEPRVDSGMAQPELIVYQPDRVARNPYFRWVLHLGLPTILSIVVHVGLVLAATVATIHVGTPPERIVVGDYETGLINTDDLTGGLSFETTPAFTPPDDELDSLDSFTSSNDFDPAELSFDTDSMGDSLSEGEGFSEGDGGVLGIGNSGAGAAGTGGFGGLGSALQVAQAGVWNLTVAAERVVYVVDFSGSIVTVEEDLTRELKRSIGRLKTNQSFNVILFYGRGRQTKDSFSSRLVPATGENKTRFIEWIRARHAEGGTNPVPAVLEAIKQRPQAIFFFSDGRFDDKAIEQINKANRHVEAQFVCLLFDEANFERSDELPPSVNEQVTRLKRLAESNMGSSRNTKPAYKTVTLRDLYGG